MIAEVILSTCLTLGYDNSFKSWMDYKTITNQSSKQYELQLKAKTNEDGIRVIDDIPLVAVSEFYGSVGEIITISADENFTAMIGDIKKPNELIFESHPVSRDEMGEITMMNTIEFIVDSKKLDDKYIESGNLNGLYKGNVQCIARGQK